MQSEFARFFSSLLEWRRQRKISDSICQILIRDLPSKFSKHHADLYQECLSGKISIDQLITSLSKELNIEKQKTKLDIPHNLLDIASLIQRESSRRIGRIQDVIDQMRSITFDDKSQEIQKFIFNMIVLRQYDDVGGILANLMSCLQVERFDFVKFDATVEYFNSMTGQTYFFPSLQFRNESLQHLVTQLKDVETWNGSESGLPYQIMRLSTDLYLIFTCQDAKQLLSFFRAKHQILSAVLSQLVFDQESASLERSQAIFLSIIKFIPLLKIMCQYLLAKQLASMMGWVNYVFSKEPTHNANFVLVDERTIHFDNMQIPNSKRKMFRELFSEVQRTQCALIDRNYQFLNEAFQFLIVNQKWTLLMFDEDEKLIYVSQPPTEIVSKSYRLGQVSYQQIAFNILPQEIYGKFSEQDTHNFDGQLYQIIKNRYTQVILREGIKDIVIVDRAMIIKKFQRAVKMTKMLLKGTKSFQSKSMIMNEYMTSTVVEFLPDYALRRIMNSNEAKLMTINMERYQAHLQKKTSQFEATLKDIAEFKPTADAFVNLSYLNQKIENIEFNIMELDSADEKVAFVWQVFQKCPLLENVHIPFEQFSNFITIIRHEYNKRENPFHNFVHGATVMHGCYTLSQTHNVQKILDITQRFAMVFAGLVHDVDHTGKNNLYEMNMRSKLATLYNDRSVLEHHHLAQTYFILQCEKADIFCKFDNSLRNEIRKCTINNILATDNKMHFQLLNSFEIKLKTFQNDPNAFDSEESKLLLSGISVHAADFFGSVKKTEVAMEWSYKVCQEFMAQSSLEVLNKIPVTPYLRGLDNPQIMAKGEIGFLSVIVKPLWESINVFAGGIFKRQIENMEETLKQWKQILES